MTFCKNQIKNSKINSRDQLFAIFVNKQFVTFPEFCGFCGFRTKTLINRWPPSDRFDQLWRLRITPEGNPIAEDQNGGHPVSEERGVLLQERKGLHRGLHRGLWVNLSLCQLPAGVCLCGQSSHWGEAKLWAAPNRTSRWEGPHSSLAVSKKLKMWSGSGPSWTGPEALQSSTGCLISWSSCSSRSHVCKSIFFLSDSHLNSVVAPIKAAQPLETNGQTWPVCWNCVLIVWSRVFHEILMISIKESKQWIHFLVPHITFWNNQSTRRYNQSIAQTWLAIRNDSFFGVISPFLWTIYCMKWVDLYQTLPNHPFSQVKECSYWLLSIPDLQAFQH